MRTLTCWYIKIKPGDKTPHVYIKPIENTHYSIRLWPGSHELRLWCMDFVDSRTREPKNSPFPSQLYAVPKTWETPWLSQEQPRPVISLQEMHGMSKDDIPDGCEKFILSDGQQCVLMIKGGLRIRFNVPVRLANGKRIPDFVRPTQRIEFPTEIVEIDTQCNK